MHPCPTIALFSLATLFTASIDADGSKIEANHGEDVTLSFPMDKAEEADRLRIMFTSESTNETRLIALRCSGSEICDLVKTPGVKLMVEGGFVNVTIQKVNSSRSGLYKAEPVGEHIGIPDVTPITLVVKAPPHSSTPKPPNSSHLLWLCALIPLVIVISGVVCFWKRRRKCESAADVESSVPMKPSTSLNVSDQVCTKKELEKQWQ